MRNTLRVAVKPHRLDGKLSAHIAEIARKFHSIATLGTGLTVDDVDRLEAEFAAMRLRAEEMEAGEPARPIIRPAVDHMLQAEETVRVMRRLIIAREQDVSGEQASMAIDTAIAELVAARAEIKAGNLKRQTDRVAS